MSFITTKAVSRNTLAINEHYNPNSERIDIRATLFRNDADFSIQCQSSTITYGEGDFKSTGYDIHNTASFGNHRAWYWRFIIPYSEKFDDCREQMISWEDYEDQLLSYCEEVGLAKGAEEFTRSLKESKTNACTKADNRFPNDELVRIKSGKLILLSEYYIRYGSYGGIAYYHVSDTYIALFSCFIPCGVHEAIYILDGLLNDESDFNPDTVHGDTQAQSTPVFGLAFLLGIKLMPRIRNIKDLYFYKPDRQTVLNHIHSLFNEPIKCDIIEKHYDDMMRIAISVNRL